MTTIESYETHKKAAELIRAMGFKAKSVRNKEADFSNCYQVKVKNFNEEELNYLTDFIWKNFNNKMINIAHA